MKQSSYTVCGYVRPHGKDADEEGFPELAARIPDRMGGFARILGTQAAINGKHVSGISEKHDQSILDPI